MADKPAKHELAAVGFLHEALDGAHLTVPLVSCVDVTVRDGAASRVYRVQAFSALAIGKSTLRSGSSDGGATIHVCDAMHGPLESVARAFHLAPGRFAGGLDAVTAHSYELMRAAERDAALLADAGPALTALLEGLGVGLGAREASGDCLRFEQEAAERGVSVVLDPFRAVSSRYTTSRASTEAGHASSGGALRGGSVAQVLPYDVEGHMLPSGERCIADTHRLCIPETRRGDDHDDRRCVAVVVKGDGSVEVRQCTVDDLTSDSSIIAAACSAAGRGTPSTSTVRREAGAGCFVVSWTDASERVIVSHPLMYWRAPHLTALYPPTAGSVLRERGIPAVSPDVVLRGGDFRSLDRATAELLSEDNVAKAASHVQGRVAECVAAGSEDVSSLRAAVKAGLHASGLGLRHAWQVWSRDDGRSDPGAGVATGVAPAAGGGMLECAFVCACLPRPGSSAGLGLQSLMASRGLNGLDGDGDEDGSHRSLWLTACLAARASAVKGCGMTAAIRVRMADRVLTHEAARRVARSWLLEQRRTAVSVKSSGVGGQHQSRLSYTMTGDASQAAATASMLGLVSELGHRQQCGDVGGQDILLQRLNRLAHRELGSSEEGVLAALRGLAQSAARLTWLGRLASILLRSGRLGSALEAYERALVIQRAALGDDHAEVGGTWVNIGSCMSRMGDCAGALEAFERGQAIVRAALGDDQVDVGRTWGNIGTCRSDMGDFTGAMEAYERALAIERAALGDDHADVGLMWGNIGGCKSRMGDYAGALEALDRASAIKRAALGEAHAGVGMTLYNIGICRSEMGDHARALEAYEHALVIQRAALGDDHADVGATWSNVGAGRSSLGNDAGALQALECGLAILRAALGDNDASVGRTWYNLSCCRASAGDAAGALEALERSLTIQRALLGNDHADVGRLWGNVGNLRARMGDYAGALEPLVKAREILTVVHGADNKRVIALNRAIEACSHYLGGS